MHEIIGLACSLSEIALLKENTQLVNKQKYFLENPDVDPTSDTSGRQGLGMNIDRTRFRVSDEYP